MQQNHKVQYINHQLKLTLRLCIKKHDKTLEMGINSGFCLSVRF